MNRNPHKITPDMLDPLLRGWQITLRSDGYPSSTIETYVKAVRYFSEWFKRPLHEATKTDVREYVASARERGLSRNTITTRVTVLKLFYRWALSEGDVDTDPTENVKTPKSYIPDVKVLTVEQVQALLDTCNSPEFIDLRDKTIILMLTDTGLRISELAGITIDNVDLGSGTVVVYGKGTNRQGKRMRVVAMGAKCTQLVSRYIRARAYRSGAGDSLYLWLGRNGNQLTAGQIRERLRKRAEQTNGVVEHVYPHMFRHTFAHSFRLNGGNDTDLMTLGGWENPQQIAKRYGRAGAEQRAHEAARRYSLGDRL